MIKKKFLKVLFVVLVSYISLANAVSTFAQSLDVSLLVSRSLIYTLTIYPQTNEIGLYTNIVATITDINGNRISGLNVRLTPVGNSAGLQYVPTMITDVSGTASFWVKSDIAGTYRFILENLSDSRSLTSLNTYYAYWVSLNELTLQELPEYTQGLSQHLYWSGGESSYQYYLEVSTSPDFTNIYASSGWVNSTDYQFDNLADGQLYYYRVKARNSGNAESSWSNVVFSIQDNTPPEVIVQSVNVLEIPDSEEFDVNVVAFISDNVLLIDESVLYCVYHNASGEDTYYECATTSNSGVSTLFTINSNSLERQPSGVLYDEYSFCISARDGAGNVTYKCGFSFETPEVEPPGTINQIINTVVNTITTDVKNIVENIVKIPEQMTETEVQTITTSIGMAPVAINLWLASFELVKIPYAITQLFLNILTLLGIKRKGKPYGFVYNSITKEPVNQAIVRVYTVEGKLINTSVTDTYGVFTAQLPKGRYRIVVSCPGFLFPATSTVGSIDYPYENVYHGEVIVTHSKNEEITISIPLDPRDSNRARLKGLKVKNVLVFLFKIISPLLVFIGFIFSLYLVKNFPSTFNKIITALYIPSIILSLRALFTKQLKYGEVRDNSGNNQKGVEIILKETTFGRAVAKRITDDYGLYRFIIRPGEYKMEIADPNISLRKIGLKKDMLIKSEDMKRPLIIAEDMVVEKKKA